MGYYCEKCEQYFVSPYYCHHWYNPEAPAFKELEMKTVEELRKYFNDNYGIEKEWPKQFEVSAELYGRVCQAVINNVQERIVVGLFQGKPGNLEFVAIAVGPNSGIMFKNVELLIKEE